jgi:hypothetical protein
VSNNHHAETEEFQGKLKELENLFNPIATRMYQGSESAGARCGNTSENQQGNAAPSADEVD